jgi:F-type H+-transporting ATPase subunit alpha
MKLDLAQFRELAAFAQFGSDLDPVTRSQLDRGMRVQEVLKQPQYQPMPIQEQVAIIYVVNSGQLDTVPVERMAEFESGFLSYMKTAHQEILDTIRERGQLNDELTEGLTNAVREYKQTAGFAK